MKKRMQMPTNPYDPAWAAWNAENPHVRKSVGAAAADEGEGGDDDAGDDQGDKSGDDGKGADDKGKGEDGKISDEVRELLKEVMTKKDRIKAQAGEIANLKAELSKFDGIDPEAVRALINDKKKAEDAELERKGEWDRLKQRMAEEHQSVLSKKDEEVNTLKAQLGQLQGQITELTVGHSFDNSPFIKDSLLLTPRKARVVYGEHFEIEDGQVVAYDKPKGHPTRTKLVDARGEPVGFDDALKKIVEADPDRDNLLKSKLKQGADSGSKKEVVEIPAGKSDGPKGLGKIAAGLATAKL